MPVKVSFGPPGQMGSVDAVSIGNMRITETIAVGATTTASALPGEIAVMISTEAGPVNAAHGATPNASATTRTAVTSASYGLPVGVLTPVAVQAGDRIAIATFA